MADYLNGCPSEHALFHHVIVWFGHFIYGIDRYNANFFFAIVLYQKHKLNDCVTSGLKQKPDSDKTVFIKAPGVSYATLFYL
jgi:hypothetical protein